MLILKLNIVYIIKIVNYNVKFISVNYEFITLYDSFNLMLNIIIFIVFWLLSIAFIIFVLYKTTLKIKVEGNK